VFFFVAARTALATGRKGTFEEESVES
jgi:hypothetical protein